MKIVSVIVPVFNVEKYLAQALDSLVQQSYPSLEIIIVNDGSTDGSLSIAEKFAHTDQRIIIIDQKNHGYGAAVNRGIERATGDYVAIFEPDDFLAKDCYKCLVEELERTHADFARCGYIEVTAEGKEVKKSRSFTSLYPELHGLSAQTHPKYIHHRISVWSCLCRMSMLRDSNIKLHESAGASFQDISYYFMLLCCAKSFSIVDKPLYYYRQHPTQSIRDKNKHDCVFGEYDYAQRFVDNILVPSKQATARALCSAMFLQKLIRHGKNCTTQHKPLFYQKLRDRISAMELNSEMIFLLDGNSLSNKIHADIENHAELSYDEFVKKRQQARFFLWGYVSPMEQLYYKYLVK